jgi:hypothetical protein
MLDNQFLTNNPKVQELMADSLALKALENQLADTDYKVIKCYEYSLVGLDLPYNIEALHAEREVIREQIRKIEEKLS